MHRPLSPACSTSGSWWQTEWGLPLCKKCDCVTAWAVQHMLSKCRAAGVLAQTSRTPGNNPSCTTRQQPLELAAAMVWCEADSFLTHPAACRPSKCSSIKAPRLFWPAACKAFPASTIADCTAAARPANGPCRAAQCSSGCNTAKFNLNYWWFHGLWPSQGPPPRVCKLKITSL